MIPFDLNSFKAGELATDAAGRIYRFVEHDNNLSYPIVCKLEDSSKNTFIESFPERFLKEYCFLLPVKKTVWIAICKSKYPPFGLAPSSIFYDSKDAALALENAYWKTIDAIPHEIDYDYKQKQDII